ncbi:MAG: ribonuclease III [Oscillospiraceae bacterium]|jgi:ribonuclease-3 family protein|nr:ribonuclease III [Oscillospiraceae bacterium]
MPEHAALSPLALAFLGDTVFDLLVRERLLREANRPPRKLQPAAAALVNARTQAAAARLLLPALDEREAAVFRRGRNAHPGHVPRSCTTEEYAYATALEALFGWLWLEGRFERARELFVLL